MTYEQIINYVWISEECLILFYVVFGDWDIYSAISSGSVAYDLVRPIGLYGKWFCQSAASRLSFSIFHCFPVIIIGCIMPKPYRLIWLNTFYQIILFMVSACIAFLIVVAFAMLMYISLFYIIAQRGIRVIVTALTSFLSGGVIPLNLFPKHVLSVVRYLPFAAMKKICHFRFSVVL